ncbi:MAG: hypothetical protein PHS66_02055 [Candidatus Omnitrophica bacterium]|nr:hypothetical protein [Candidatus Omnitrophota bacterium]
MKSEEKSIEEERFKWAFGDVGIQSINNDEIIYGRLGRTIKQKFGTVYDQNKHSYKKDLIKSSEAAYSNFFIMPKFNIIALEDKYNLTKKLFISKFKEFWDKNDYTDIKFEFLKDEIEIFDLVKSWDRLSRATFDLVPSNPSSRDDWKEVDEIIRKAEAKRAKLEFENREKGLAKQGSVIQKSMSMAADGYGEFKLKGWIGNVGQTFNSLSTIIKKEIHSVDELPAILGQLYKEIKKILERKKENG